jgi:hypothetical protein
MKYGFVFIAVLAIAAVGGFFLLKKDLSPIESVPAKNPLPGQIVPSAAHPQWLVYADGSPFFLAGLGDPEGFLYRADQAEIIDYLTEYGGNSLYVQSIRSHGGDGGPEQNPFINFDPQNRLNEEMLDKWEKWFSLMDERGITVFFFFYDDGIHLENALGWPLDQNGNLHPQERYYVESIVNRFEHHKHLIWVVMEEAQEMGGDYVRHVKKIAETVKSADDYSHTVAVHISGNQDFSAFANDPNIDQFAMHKYMGSVHPQDYHKETVEAFEAARGRYNLVYAEPIPLGKLLQDGDRDALRKHYWAIAMGGAYVMMFGAWDGYYGGVPSPEMLADLRRVQVFFESIDFYGMVPHDELGHGSAEYVLAVPGENYIVYSSHVNDPIGIKDIPAGTYDFMWYDPITGQRVEQTGVELSQGSYVWTKPQEFGSELSLHILRK